MRYGSVCSGIEAASVAWEPLGWRAEFLAEIDKFPSAVLAHRYPRTPNLGDFTKIGEGDAGPIELLVGGTPCQSFSLAGKRRGLDDPRGHLALEFLSLARRLRPRWVVWENVPGVLSQNRGRDFGAFLGALGECGYGFAYRVLDAQFTRVSTFRGAVPQRRRRVFVVGYLGDWRPATAALFEPEGLHGHPAPRREAGESVAAFTANGVRVCGADDNQAQAGHLVAKTLTAHSGRCDAETETETIIPIDTTAITSAANHSNPQPGAPCHTLSAGAHPPAIAIQERAVCENPNAGPDGAGFRSDGAAYTLEARTTPQAVAFSYKDHGGDAAAEVAPTMRSLAHAKSHANSGSHLAVAFDLRGREGGAQLEGPHETANIRATSGGSSRSYVFDRWAVRRLSVIECERLQGLPDGYTQIPWRGKPADGCPDGPRYKALGNSMAVNVMRWIGERIDAVDRIIGERP